MWSRFFPGRCSILGKNLRFENSGAELKMSREQQEVYIKYVVLQFAKMELRTYFSRTPKRRRKNHSQGMAKDS